MTVEKKLTLIQEPSTLILQLMRYKFDSSRKKASKVHLPVICTRNLEMPSGATYCLKSYVNHEGENTRSGHYTVNLFDTATSEVVLLDDDKVYDVADASNEKVKRLIFSFMKNLLKNKNKFV